MQDWSPLLGTLMIIPILVMVIALLRWAFSTRRATATRRSPSVNVNDPTLRVIEALPSQNAGLAKSVVLASHGVDAQIIRSDGELFLAVHVAQVRTARAILGLTDD